MKKKVTTPVVYLSQRATHIQQDIHNMHSRYHVEALLKDWAKQRKIADSEVFRHVDAYWSQYPSLHGSITDMVRIWYLATLGLLSDQELDDLLQWFADLTRK